MGQVDFRGILHQEHSRVCLQARLCLLPVRLHEHFKGDIGFDPRKRDKAFTSCQVCMCWGTEAEASRAIRAAVLTARLVRRISLSWADPNVMSAHGWGSNTSCVFISLC